MPCLYSVMSGAATRKTLKDWMCLEWLSLEQSEAFISYMSGAWAGMILRLGLAETVDQCPHTWHLHVTWASSQVGALRVVRFLLWFQGSKFKILVNKVEAE